MIGVFKKILFNKSVDICCEIYDKINNNSTITDGTHNQPFIFYNDFFRELK